MVKILDKFTQLNSISDVWAPHYNGGDPEVYIATWKVNRSKLPIKLKFARINNTSAFAGYWYITPKKVRSYRQRYDNNGTKCYIVPWEAFERLEIDNLSRERIW